MDKDKHITRAVFRVFPGGDRDAVIAIFPEVPYDRAGDFCMSYQHIGQHGSAAPSLIPHATRAARPEEIAPLKTELEGLGYRIEVRQRVTFAMHQKRRDAARRAA